MAIKTKLPIEFSCGHTETVDLARVPAGRRKAHAFGLGKNRVCTSCFRKKSAEDLELQNRQTLLDADQFAQEHDLPDLTGSDKQVNWATRVRYQVLSDVLVSDETPDQHQQITDVLAIPIGSLVAPAAVIGAALGFGAQRLVQDLLSGFFIITEKQYGFGDLVELTITGGGTATGTVESVTLRVTTLRDVDGARGVHDPRSMRGGSLGLDLLVVSMAENVFTTLSHCLELAHLDLGMLLLTFVMAIVASVLAGLLPAWRAMRARGSSSSPSMRSSGSAGCGGRRSSARRRASNSSSAKGLTR